MPFVRTLVALCFLVAVGPAVAQTAPGTVETARIRVGPIGLNPSISITNVGIDTNIFNDAQDPKEDVTATFRPQLEGIVRVRFATLRVTGAVEALYFKRYDYLRSAQPNGSANLEVRGNRASAFAAVNVSRTRQRTSFEIDDRPLQTQESLTVGGDVRLGGKTAIGLAASYAFSDLVQDPSEGSVSIGTALNRRQESATAFVRYDIAPLTTILVRADAQRDTFDTATFRNTRRLRITPGVEFKPFALFSGFASIGYSRMELVESFEPPLSNLFAAIDLGYTVRGRLRLGVQGTRDVFYSAQPDQPYYVTTGFTGSVSQALSPAVAVAVRAGRQRLDYNQVPGLGSNAVAAGVDTIESYGGGVVWRVRPDLQLGINADQQQRRTASSERNGYRGLRAGAFLTFGP